MPFPTAAISGGNLNLLRNTSAAVPAYRGAQYASVDANTVVLACRIASVSNFDGIGEFAFNSVSSGAAANVKAGMTIWISRTNDIRAAYWVGRIRVVPSGTTFGIIYINESSSPFEANDYVFVTADFRIWPKLGREVAGVFYVDYDITFRQLLPRITGLQRAYANWVTSGFYEIAFSAVQGYAATTSATIASYLWAAADGTYVVGNSASQNPTIKFPPGERYIYLTVTDSSGRTLTRAIKIFAHDPSTYPPALGFGGASWGCQDPKSGWEASCEAFDDAEDALDGSLIVFWSDETVGGTDGSIGSNVNWAGNIRAESNRGRTDETYSYESSVNFTLEGSAQQLARVHKALIPMTNTASPSVWGEISNFTPWRGAWYFVSEYTTFANVCDVGIDDTSNTFLYPGLTTQGNSPLDVLNDIGVSINSHMEFAPTGEAQFVRDLRFKSTADRNAAVKIADWTTTDFTGELNIDVDHVETVGLVNTSSGFYSSAAGQTTPLLSMWPGVAQNYPDGQSSLTRQILAADVTKLEAEDEQNERSGRQGAISNPTDRISAQHPDAYGNAYLVPSFGYYWTWTLDDTTNIRGRSYTTSNRFFLVSASFAHDNGTGTREARAAYIEDIDEDTLGAPGTTVNYPPQGEIDLSIPDIPPFDAFPAFPEEPMWFDDATAVIGDEVPDPNTIGGKPPRDGNTLIIGGTADYLTQNFAKAVTPKWGEVTPLDQGALEVRAALFDQRAALRRAWIAVYDSGDDISSVFSASDVYSLDPDWIQGATLDEEYTVLRQTSRGIALYGPNITASSTTITDDLTTSLGPQTGIVSATYPFSFWQQDASPTVITNAGEYSITGGRTGGGSILGEDTGFTIFGGQKSESTAFIDLGAEYTVIEASHWFKNGANNKPYSAGYTFYNAAKTLLDRVIASGGGPSTSSTEYREATYSGSQANVRYIAFSCEQNVADGVPNIDDLSVTYTIGSGAGAKVAFSSTDGGSFSVIASVGDSPGSVGGFDVSRSSPYSWAAADETVMRATSIGGPYTADANGDFTGAQPRCIVWPYYARNSTTTRNATQYIVGLSAAIAGASVFWVTTSQVDITPTISGDPGLATFPNCITGWKGTKLAAVLSFGGTRRLVTSLNGGNTWTNRGATLAGQSLANARFIRGRRGDLSGNQLWIALTNGKVLYSKNWGVSWVVKSTPSGSSEGVFDVLG